MTATEFMFKAGMVAEAMGDIVERVRRSLVVVSSGRGGAGAGVIWRSNGVIITNHHVIARGNPQVLLPDGRTLRAQVAAADSQLDLAVLLVDAVGLPPAAIGDSHALRVGNLLLAIGHPWGQRDYVTAGIVTRFGRIRGGPRGSLELIHSDVALAPGNSGGPLVNAAGQVVGINAMIVGGDLGVAIPSHEASVFVAAALDRRVSLGVGVRPAPLPESVLSQVGRAQAAGLMVVELQPHGPAAGAGVIPGDILVDLGGAPLDSERALMHALLPHSPGARVPVSLLRAGVWQRQEIELAALESAS